ncbi:unnamed protein product [Rotaria sordida]|uniref:RWD domain-containing protein n=1 Tax=Rotaria sordida TaxID=392033 RepID=A0A813SZC4_9BILA|nr:unnamed protein product [Rotaria sordida]CAF0810649.1 unnamed protein product [Rotaria sordida]CAF0838546.1 unnamed protein product [Rotaria sordida]CAF0897300.1 unnamed protein product [Rotaria sordida]CAF3560311.1 unnamed protein product [Rotaria sordida]
MATKIENKSNSAGQEEEMNLLRDHFKDNIRILSSIGQFSYILKIRADQYDVSLTLQLDGSYPKKPPEIIITAPRLTPDQILLVQKLLQSYSETLRNQPMILSIYSRLLKWFDENNIQALTININNNTSTPRSPTNGRLLSPTASINNHNKISHNDEHNNEEIKKYSMKTADDIISYIECDNRLDKHYIRVGYIDHILGLQEKPFNDFDFKTDLSTINDRHTNILDISKNRIQHFKYANEIIWDKKSHIDLIFGSTGNQQTIDDIIKRHENLIETKSAQDEKPIDMDHNLSTKRYLTLTDGLYKPNYLISIPINDSSIISHYIAYREHLLSTYPSIFSSSSSHILLIDPHHLHLTLLTLRLESSLQIEQCILALKRIQEEIHYHCSYPERICLEFHGIDTFHSKTLFIKCQQNNRLDNLRTLTIERLYEQQQKHKMNNILFAGNYQEFIPHIIIFKSKRKFLSIHQNETNDIYFGKQFIDALQLSSISTNENEQQMYHCIFKLDLS